VTRYGIDRAVQLAPDPSLRVDKVDNTVLVFILAVT
jgi:hypothetical protein